MTPLDLAPGAVHVWYAPIGSIGDAAVRWCRRLLSASEQRQHEALRSPDRRAEYAVAHALLRCVLSRYDARDPRSWAFRTAEHGRPELHPAHPLRFSISHCEGLAVCAVANHDAVGVDAEPVTRGEEVLAARSVVLSPAEARDVDLLETLHARAHRALVLWTLKEAYLKARGVGLSVPPAEVSFVFERAGTPILEHAGPRECSRGWGLWSFHLRGYQLAVAHEGDAVSASAPRILAANPDTLARWSPVAPRRDVTSQ